ncbi:MAG: hypothetical protein FJ040_01705 [Chloroflexi bacterium]|nr:hypothetical protein [Chloroflexota bacterium]
MASKSEDSHNEHEEFNAIGTLVFVLLMLLGYVIYSVFIFGIRLPSPVGRIDPTNIDQSEFATPGLTQEADGVYT